MKGIYLHPLRLAALDRMTVLRVPMKVPDGALVIRFKSNGHPVIKTAESTVYIPKPPYAPGDHFVKEAFWESGYSFRKYPDQEDWEDFGWCGANGNIDYIFYAADGRPKVRGHNDWGYPIGESKHESFIPDRSNRSWAKRPSVHMKEWAARYILTLGPPVPCRLGEVDVVQQRDEGVIIEIGDEYRRTWDALYPRHPYSPDLWTWGYPMEVRRL